MDGNHVSVALKVVGRGVVWVVYFGVKEVFGLYDCHDCWGCGLWVVGLGFGVVWVGVGRHEAQAPSNQVKNYKQT